MNLVDRLLGWRVGERLPVALGALYFFCLLASYYLLRPVRDEMGIRAGVEQLQWLFTATFVVMLLAVPLFGWLSSRLPRIRLIAVFYGLFVVVLLLFYRCFDQRPDTVWVARGFYVLVSVYNLFIISVFWSFMADVFDRGQARRLFAIVAAGGTAGAIAGPAVAAWAAQALRPEALLPMSAVLLSVALGTAVLLHRSAHDSAAEQALGGGWFDGVQLMFNRPLLLKLAVFIWLYTTLSTFLYFEQAHIVRNTFASSADRTSVFAVIDLTVNVLTVLLQLAITGRLIRRFGLGRALAAVPLVVAGGFAVLVVMPALVPLLVLQVVRRAGNYGLTRPAREMVYTSVDRAARYKAKNLIDTVVYRGGDALAGWLFTALSKGLGLGVAGISAVAVPVALLWSWLGYRIGREVDVETPEERTSPDA